MRKIILSVAITLDGLIEGPNGEYDWCFTDQDYGMTEFLNSVDAIFYGRKSFDVMNREREKSGETPFAGKRGYVFSNTLKVAAGATIISGDVVAAVNKIRQEAGKDIWLFGGANLAENLINAGLVDRLWLAVHPILLGEGKPLFQGLTTRTRTRLLDTKTYATGLVSLSYEIIKP